MRERGRERGKREGKREKEPGGAGGGGDEGNLMGKKRKVKRWLEMAERWRGIRSRGGEEEKTEEGRKAGRQMDDELYILSEFY